MKPNIIEQIQLMQSHSDGQDVQEVIERCFLDFVGGKHFRHFNKQTKDDYLLGYHMTMTLLRAVYK